VLAHMVAIKVQVLNVLLQPGPPYRIHDCQWTVLPGRKRITNLDLVENRLMHVRFCYLRPRVEAVALRKSVAEFTHNLVIVLAQLRRWVKLDARYRGDRSLGKYNPSEQRMSHLS
jgi:hypothetical protein